MERFSQFLKDERGVSLIQILMASSAIAGLALIGLRLSEDQKKLAQSTYENYLVEYVTQEVRSVLSDPSVCSLTFEKSDPSGDAISELRRSEKKGDGERLIHIHFPVNDGGQEGTFFNSRLKLLSYEIKPPQGDESKKQKEFILHVNFELSSTGEEIEREIPILYTLNHQGGIETCKVNTASSTGGSSDGFWRKKGQDIQLENLRLKVGELEMAKSQVVVEGAMKLEAEDATVCDEETEGVLINKKGSLVYCSQGSWKGFGLTDPLWDKQTPYRVAMNQKGENAEKTKPHRLCYLRGQERRHINDGCFMARDNRDFRSTYTIKAYTTSTATKNICEVACVD